MISAYIQVISRKVRRIPQQPWDLFWVAKVRRPLITLKISQRGYDKSGTTARGFQITPEVFTKYPQH